MNANAKKNKMIIYPLLLLKVLLDDEYPHCTYSPCLISTLFFFFFSLFFYFVDSSNSFCLFAFII